MISNRCEQSTSSKAANAHIDSRLIRKDCRTPSFEWTNDFNSFCSEKNRYWLFRAYLVSKRCEHLLDLRTVVKGYKKQCEEGMETDDLFKHAKVIYKKLKANAEWIEHSCLIDTKEAMKRFKKAQTESEQKHILENIFENAKHELEEGLRDSFSNFLHSEKYINFVQSLKKHDKNDDNHRLLEDGNIIVNVMPSSSTDEAPVKPSESEKYSSHRHVVKSEHFHEKVVGTLPTEPKNEGERKIVLDFASKLERMKKEKEDEEKASSTLRKLKRLNGEQFALLPPQLVLDAMKDEIKLTDTSANDASDQSILDDHISRVFSPDNSPITRSRSEFKTLPSNSSLSNPPVVSRDDYMIDGYHNNQVYNEKSYYKKPQQIKLNTYNKCAVLHEHKGGNSYIDSDQPTKDSLKSLYRNNVKSSLMQRAYGDGMSSTNLNMISEESFSQRRQEYEGFVKALPTPMGPGVVSDKIRSKLDANKRFDKRRSIQQPSRVPVKLGLFE
ncbi:hypothetical protein B4U80_13227 [Leptotrombidium deliense]|uniref:RGS domain-containing protein n=1 Tax=Leptotrombidium deliense TaxID=299467 RepID=A0A443SA21_9ACAR|nr:hypothetical protein B4U80_13227 [Leptotrombidium deliense]